MALQFDVSGWCHERDRRWPDYHSQAAHSPWPQTHVFLREDAEVRLWAAVRGVGGGAQQATFRNELEERLEAGWCACLTADWPAGPSACLRAFEAEVQHAFVSSTNPVFATQFGALWAVALTQGSHCAVLTLATNRAYLVREGEAQQLTRDRSLFTLRSEQPGPAAGPSMDHHKEVYDRCLNLRSSKDAHLGELSSFTWQAGDALALVTGLHPDDVTEPLIAQVLSTAGDSAQLSRRLYETLQAGTRTRATSEGSERRDHAFLRQAVVVVARQA